MATYCESCGARIEDPDSRFCERCGALVAPPASPPKKDVPLPPPTPPSAPATQRSPGRRKMLLVIVLAFIAVIVIAGLFTGSQKPAPGGTSPAVYSAEKTATYAVAVITTAPPPDRTTSPPTKTSGYGATLIDEFAAMKGTFPQLFSDGSDSTYVGGGIYAGDWDGKFLLPVKDTDVIKFRARVECFKGSCGGKDVCGFCFHAKNEKTGKYDLLSSAPWDSPGIHEYTLVINNPDDYIQNGRVEFWISLQCNMDGRVMEFYQIG